MSLLSTRPPMCVTLRAPASDRSRPEVLSHHHIHAAAPRRRTRAAFSTATPPSTTASSPAGPLAVYPFPRSPTHDQSLFAGAISHVMSHLATTRDERPAPFVQLSSPVRHSRSAASRWDDVLSILPKSADTRLLLLVRPIDDPFAFCGSPSSACDGMCPDGVASVSVHLQGTAGECCDDAADGHPHPDHHSDPGHASAQDAARRLLETPDADLDASYASSHGLDVRYFGVVSQSRADLGSDGCYIVKTVHEAGASACHCMHYSLMRVCQGAALGEQVLSYWA